MSQMILSIVLDVDDLIVISESQKDLNAFGIHLKECVPGDVKP